MEPDEISTKVTRAVTDLAEAERIVIDLRARLAASEAKVASQQAQINELKVKLLELIEKRVDQLEANAQ